MAATSPESAREWHLVRRPDGALTVDDLRLVDVEVPAPRPGQVLVRNTHLSVDPYMRGRMDDKESYVPPFELNAPLEGDAVGVVVESLAEGLLPGQMVTHMLGLREFAVLDAVQATPIDLAGLPAEVHLGSLGGAGFAAWLGLTSVAEVRPGDTVLVTGAAGAVGSVAGQVARLRGAARVIGTVGSPGKVRYVTEELGYDSAFDHHDGDLDRQLAQAAPGGIDVVFDNVGGAQLEAALNQLSVGARIALCGMASQYDGKEPYGVSNLFEVITKRAAVQGFMIPDHADQLAAFHTEAARWLRDGEVIHHENVVDGIEQLPVAMLDLFRSGTTSVGKTVVRLADAAGAGHGR